MTIGLFEVTESIGQVLATSLTNLLDKYDLKSLLMSKMKGPICHDYCFVVSYEFFCFEESIQGTCFGHAFSKACQYPTQKKKRFAKI